MSTFGAELRRERELREISLIEVAEATKISTRFLEALERNDFSSLPGGLYNRGIVRAYSQFIGADPEAMVNAYLLEEQTRSAPRRPSDPALLRGSPGGDPQHGSVPSRSNRKQGISARWIVAVVIVALVVVAVLLFIRFSGGTRTGISPSLAEWSARVSLTAGVASGGDLG
jgi:cytoskeleton protein RodZ